LGSRNEWICLIDTTKVVPVISGSQLLGNWTLSGNLTKSYDISGSPDDEREISSLHVHLGGIYTVYRSDLVDAIILEG
jgi:hypothetical protein